MLEELVKSLREGYRDGEKVATTINAYTFPPTYFWNKCVIGRKQPISAVTDNGLDDVKWNLGKAYLCGFDIAVEKVREEREEINPNSKPTKSRFRTTAVKVRKKVSKELMESAEWV